MFPHLTEKLLCMQLTKQQVVLSCRYHDVDPKNYQLIEHLVRKGISIPATSLLRPAAGKSADTDDSVGHLPSRDMHVVSSMAQGTSNSRCSATVTSAAYTSQSRISESV